MPSFPIGSFFKLICCQISLTCDFRYRYCRMLEEGSFRGRTADFVFMFLFGGFLMTVSFLLLFQNTVGKLMINERELKLCCSCLLIIRWQHFSCSMRSSSDLKWSRTGDAERAVSRPRGGWKEPNPRERERAAEPLPRPRPKAACADCGGSALYGAVLMDYLCLSSSYLVHWFVVLFFSSN